MEHVGSLFMDQAHKAFFYEQMTKRKVSNYDVERIALFYTLGLLNDTRQHIDSIYSDNGIEPDVLRAPFVTSGSKNLILIAFSLFNNFKVTEQLPLQINQIHGPRPNEMPGEALMEIPLSTKLLLEDCYMEYETFPSLLSLFCYFDHEIIPYLFKAIMIRLGMATINIANAK